MSSPAIPNPFPDADAMAFQVAAQEKAARMHAIVTSAAYVDLSTRIAESTNAWTRGNYHETFHFNLPITLETLRLVVEQLRDRGWECECDALDDPAVVATDNVFLCSIGCEGTRDCLVVSKENLHQE